MWDVGGCDKIRPLWRHYYYNTSIVIFVIDSNDRDRMDEARSELHRMLNEDELRDAVLLVIANKQDLPTAMSAAEVEEALELRRLSHREWRIFPTHMCATAEPPVGPGLAASMDWLVATLTRRRHGAKAAAAAAERVAAERAASLANAATGASEAAPASDLAATKEPALGRASAVASKAATAGAEVSEEARLEATLLEVTKPVRGRTRSLTTIPLLFTLQYTRGFDAHAPDVHAPL